jgi:hypothetical protein
MSQEIRNLQEAYLNVYCEDREPGVKPYKSGPTGAEVRADAKRAAKNKEASSASGYGGSEKFNKPDDKIQKPGTEVPKSKKGGYRRISRVIPHGIGAHKDKITSRITTITNRDPGAPRSQKMVRDHYDLYDLILSHLLNEGYAETPEAAEAIMVNMSEEWRESIVEDISIRSGISSGYSTKPGDNKPYKDGPLWDSDQKPEDVPVKKPNPPVKKPNPPMRAEPLF